MFKDVTVNYAGAEVFQRQRVIGRRSRRIQACLPAIWRRLPATAERSPAPFGCGRVDRTPNWVRTVHGGRPPCFRIPRRPPRPHRPDDCHNPAMYRFPDNERRGHNPPPRSCRPIGGTPSLFRSAAPAPRPPLPASPRPIAHRMYGPQMLPQAATHHQPPAPHTPQPECPAASSAAASKKLSAVFQIARFVFILFPALSSTHF